MPRGERRQGAAAWAADDAPTDDRGDDARGPGDVESRPDAGVESSEVRRAADGVGGLERRAVEASMRCRTASSSSSSAGQSCCAIALSKDGDVVCEGDSGTVEERSDGKSEGEK